MAAINVLALFHLPRATLPDIISFEMGSGRTFMTLGMFILDRFEYLDEQGQPTGRKTEEQIGGGGTYAAIGARMFLPDNQISMLVDRGNDFDTCNQEVLDSYGNAMWIFRDHADRGTTKALNLYHGEHRGFEYLTPRIRITPKDFSPSTRARYLHFICSPKRAQEIMAEVDTISDWNPMTIFEPIPDRCVPSELEALRDILPRISILSPNASEACSLLSLAEADDGALSKQLIEDAANVFYAFGSECQAKTKVIIRSGEMGAYVKDSEDAGLWIDAYWGANDISKVVDVTGAGNAFLGGLAAGLSICNDDIRKAVEYATISASFTIEQHGLPTLKDGLWNGDRPEDRLHTLKLKG